MTKRRAWLLVATFAALAVILGVVGAVARRDGDAPEPEPDAGADGVLPLERVSTAAWLDELRAQVDGVEMDSSDMAKFYDLMADQCRASDLALTLGQMEMGAEPTVLRISFRHVCPSQRGRLEAAIAEADSLMSPLEKACTKFPGDRTAEEQAVVDGGGGCP